MKHWFVYIIKCTDGSLYTGITTDVERRYLQHTMQKGAKYFRGRKPMELVFKEDGHNRSSAAKRECQIKKLSRLEKISLISSIENKI